MTRRRGSCWRRRRLCHVPRWRGPEGEAPCRTTPCSADTSSRRRHSLASA